MSDSKRTVLITGCSAGGMGAELAKEFQRKGLEVIATARDASKMKDLASLGIRTLSLDVASESSIEACAKQVTSLDILINNAGASYTMPISDISLPDAKKLFDTNVWGGIATIQAFLPLLIKSPRAMVVNHTSVGAGFAIPFQATYNASKAAMSMFSEALRLELQAFNIAVVNLKTGGVKTNIVKNVQIRQPELPADSIYSPAKEVVEKALGLAWVEEQGIPAEQWAKEVVADLLKASPPPIVWRGESAWLAWFGTFLPFGTFDGMLKKMTGLGEAERIIRDQKSKG